MDTLGFFADYSFSQAPPLVIKANGYRGIGIYLGPARPPKEYVQAARDAGLEIFGIQETQETRAYEGFNAGVEDARSANASADEIGLPIDCTICYVLADTPVTPPSTMPAVAGYCSGVRSFNGRPPGWYGNENALTAGRDSGPGWLWGIETWSNARNGLAGWEGFGCALIQMANSREHDIPGYSTDEDRQYVENFGQWGAAPVQDPLPVSELAIGVDMLKFTDDKGTSAEFLTSYTKLFVRYWKAGELSEPILLSEDVEPGCDLLAFSAFGVTLIHAPSNNSPGKIVETYPGPYGYASRLV